MGVYRQRHIYCKYINDLAVNIAVVSSRLAVDAESSDLPLAIDLTPIDLLRLLLDRAVVVTMKYALADFNKVSMKALLFEANLTYILLETILLVTSLGQAYSA